VTLVTITRNPADIFFSLYQFVNALKQADLGGEITADPRYRKLIGNALDSAEVLDFLVHDFNEVTGSALWILSGKALVVRYEDLNPRPEATLAELCKRIWPVPVERIRDAIAACGKDALRGQSAALGVIVRRGLVGEGLQTLLPIHRQLIREKYADELPILGYSL
jgi:hypothetical protein